MHEGSPHKRDFLLWWKKSGQESIMRKVWPIGIKSSFDNTVLILLILGTIEPQHDYCQRQSSSGDTQALMEKSVCEGKCIWPDFSSQRRNPS